MHACLCACMCACVSMCVCMCMCACVCACMCAHACILHIPYFFVACMYAHYVSVCVGCATLLRHRMCSSHLGPSLTCTTTLQMSTTPYQFRSRPLSQQPAVSAAIWCAASYQRAHLPSWCLIYCASLQVVLVAANMSGASITNTLLVVHPKMRVSALLLEYSTDHI